MRSEHENPAYQRFRHLLLPNGRYPAEHVEIFWNRRLPSSAVADVEVVFIPRSHLSREADRGFWEDFDRYCSRWRTNLGNSTTGWMTPDGYTPELVFGLLLRYDFDTTMALKHALDEFAHIEECAWARQMLLGFIQG